MASNATVTNTGGTTERRLAWLDRFHRGRLYDFAEFVRERSPGGRALSIGCGTGHLETEWLHDHFDEIWGLDARDDRTAAARSNGLDVIQAHTPPIPLDDDSVDTIVMAGTIEHIPDEAGILRECKRVLTPGGGFYLTIPIEVGVGGLVRFLGKNVLRPGRNDTPDDWRRFVDYTWEELRKQTPREKHDVYHRYYNYTCTIEDLRTVYEEVEVQGWPVSALGELNPVLFVKARRER